MTSRIWIAQGALWWIIAGGITPALAGSMIPAADTTPPPYLGLRAGARPPPPHSPDALPEPGLLVLEVDAAGPVAGIVAPQDLLYSVNGQLLFNVPQWRALLSTLAPGSELELVLSRQDVTQRVSVVLGARAAGTLTPWPEFEESDEAAGTTGEGDATPDAEDPMFAPGAERIDTLLDHIRQSYEDSLPSERIDPVQMEQFMEDVRKHLASADLNAPLHPDAYRVRPLPNLTPTGDKDLVMQGGDEANLVISIRDGEKVYTYRDPDGNVIYQGALETREDREKVPLEVWKKLYELERAEQVSRPGADVTRP